MPTLNMQYSNDKCVVGINMDGVPNSVLIIKETAEVPCIHIKTNSEILGNRNLKEITYIIPERIGYKQHLMLQHII